MSSLLSTDPELHSLLAEEDDRERDTVRLIASENFASAAVREASGSRLTNKYSEGYPGARYYEGQQVTDAVERIAIARAKAVFGAEHANVQPYSGSPANVAVYLAFLKPGDTVLGMRLSHGGHLTHGSKVSITGKHWNTVFYDLDRETGCIDYDQVRALAREHKPKLLIAGHSAYPRHIDFAAFRAIADEVGAILLVDMAHFAGLVAGGAHPSPVPFADVVTTTTHKTLRGPRGAMILCKAEHAARIDKAVFPGMQGGPHNATTAAIAVTLKEAAEPAFSAYAHAAVANAQALAGELAARGFDLVTGGTDNHLILVDLRSKGLGGKPVAVALDRAGIVANCNAVPWDDRSPQDPSGLRLGSPAMTTRGFGPAEFRRVAAWIDRVVASGLDEAAIAAVARDVMDLCRTYPLP
jgi:glycine hydroxymethyltransferase